MRFPYSIALLCLLPSLPLQGAESFGDFQKPPLSARPLPEVLAEKSSGNGELRAIEGRVQKVCEKKGCWMTLEDKGQSVRVVFKGYSFFVPLKWEGQRVIAEGVLKSSEQSVAAQKHLLEDAGASPQEIAAVKQAKRVFEFEANAVRSL